MSKNRKNLLPEKALPTRNGSTSKGVEIESHGGYRAGAYQEPARYLDCAGIQVDAGRSDGKQSFLLNCH